MECAQHIVKLDPDAVELVDSTMIGLARGNDAFAPIVARFIRGAPEAILLVEFGGDDRDAQLAKLARLVELMGDLGLPGSVVEVTDPRLQKDIWEVRKAGLNIMMSMKGDGKPVSFIEDCAVPLEHLAEYTDRLTRVFEKHGTRGTWYAHASVGTLHVRPVLNMKTDGARKMRAIAEEACAMVREYKGAAFSGEHGDGLVRSEWIEPIIGPQLARALAEIKDLFDPKGLMNPGKIVRPIEDGRPLALPLQARLRDAAARHRARLVGVERPGGGEPGLRGRGRDVQQQRPLPQVRRRHDVPVVPRDRRRAASHPRPREHAAARAVGAARARTRLASDALYETLDLCVGCKGCKRECPTGVDMARMKIEFLHHYHGRNGWGLKDRLIAFLPRYAPLAARLAPLANLRDRVPFLAQLSETLVGLSAKRSLPKWQARPFLKSAAGRYQVRAPEDCDVVLLADTFNNYFEPENAVAALRVLEAAGYRVHVARPADAGRPLCCGRTFLAVGMVNEARYEARRLLDALLPYAARSVPIVGLEPSCLLTLRDELGAMLPGDEAAKLGANAWLFEEFLAREADAGRLALALNALPGATALLHGHCHQKAFGAMPAVERALKLVPGLAVETIESSCCGMAGAFGYEAKHYDVSMKMAESALLPKVRAADADVLVVADGTSCRHQIADGAGREAVHVARVLERALG